MQTKFAKLLTLTTLTVLTIFMIPNDRDVQSGRAATVLTGVLCAVPSSLLGGGSEADSGRSHVVQFADSQSHFRILLEQQGFFAIRAGCGQYDQHGDRITGAARAVHYLSFNLLVLLYERNVRSVIECV